MVPDRSGASRRLRKKAGAHRKARRRRAALTRTVAAGGAALAIGAAGTPTAGALTILLPGPTVDGESNTTRIDIFEGNVFNPQFGIDGNSSNNLSIGNIAANLGNAIINQLLDVELNFGGAAAAGNGNVTQITLFSYNIFNPQFSLGPNVSTNTTISNVAMNNGNNSQVVGAGGVPLFGAAMGNGNTVQFSLFSGNIFNPQFSIGGNASNNTATSNLAAGNGNYSQTSVGLNLFGNFLFGGGNGNTFQLGLFVSNIYNPQWSWGGGNVSNNTATTNASIENGNHSDTVITGTGGLGTVVTGTVGNGHTDQAAGGSGNIINNQVNVGPSPTGASSNDTVTSDQQTPDPVTVGSNDTDLDITTLRENESSRSDLSSGDTVPAGSNDNAPDNQQETPGPSGPESPPPSSADTGNNPTNDTGDGQTNGDGGGTDGGGGGTDGGGADGGQ
jgi:hypothetical protein